MDHCSKCNKDTESRVNRIKKKMVCTVCGTEKGPAPESAPLKEVVVEGPKAIISVSVDEWVVIKKASGAWLYTQDLLGCIAVTVESDERIALAHVLDRNKSTGDEDQAAHELDLIVAVLGKSKLTDIHLIITDEQRVTPTYKLVRGWAEKQIAKKDIEDHRGANLVRVCPDVRPGRTKLDKEERKVEMNPKTGVKWITNWGKLPKWRGHVGE